MYRFFTLFLLAFLLGCSTSAPDATSPRGPRALVVVVDGLRPEYVTQSIMPRLARLRDEGFSGQAHHAVYPTVTRVNSPSIATGSYPRTHGMMGNNIYVPAAADRVLSTGDRADLLLLEEAAGGALLTAPTLAEVLADEGRVLFAASSGSSGSGYLLNPRLGLGGLVHYEYVLPDTMEAAVEDRLGPRPLDDQQPNLHRVRYAIDAVLEIGIDYLNADAILLWITEPDGTAHANGIGAAETIEALNGVDEEIGRLLDELNRRGGSDTINLFFTADHGFSTHTGQTSLADLLVDKGLKTSPESDDVVLAGGAIHVNENPGERIPAIVQLLQDTEWIGPVFTRDGLEGTLPMSAAFWDHERSADILTSYNWTASENEHGYPGEVTSPGVAGHGSASPYDIRTFFAITGPDIKMGAASTVPSGNVDIAPTVLHLLGLPVAASMDGRVLTEALEEGPSPDSVLVERADLTAQTDSYTLILERSKVGDHYYVHSARVER